MTISFELQKIKKIGSFERKRVIFEKDAKRNENKIMSRFSPGLLNTTVSTDHDYLGISRADLAQKGAILTAREISQQPELWMRTYELVREKKTAILHFLRPLLANPSLSVMMTGAGSSAYIGNALQGLFQKYGGRPTTTVPTTDLISHPQHYFPAHGELLLISFARSGESPESVAAVNLANEHCKKVYHFIITCNPLGRLAQVNGKPNQSFVFLMPAQANDLSLAMTGSFTSMLLAGLLIARINEIDTLQQQVLKLAGYGQTIISNYRDRLEQASLVDFDRAVFLGSGPLQAVAKECELKLQELTDGRLICKFDSFLGFRHGPRAVVNQSTLLVYLFSNNDYVYQYERDLVNAISPGKKSVMTIGILESKKDDIELDLAIIVGGKGSPIDEDFLSVCGALPAQLLGFFKSLHFGLSPDNPSEKGTITRVVEGVTIYPIS